MKLQYVPPREGVQWARQGLRAFLKRPLSYMGLFGLVLMAVLVAQLLWWLGSLLLWAAMPFITLGFMVATHEVLQGKVPTFKVFLSPLRSDPARKRAMLQLGGSYALLMLLIVLVHSGIDDGRIAALQAAATREGSTPEEVSELLSDPRLQYALIWFAGAAGVLSLPFWHAPALVYWGGQSAAQAVFSSTLACWRNKGAFFLYALTGVAAVVAFALLSSLLFGLFGAPNLAAVLLTPAVMVFTAIFYASLYFTYAGCFDTGTLTSNAPDSPLP